jgi:N,N-dimethylformamidase
VIVLPGVMAYPDRLTTHPGERVTFHISVDGGGDYETTLVRLICGDTGPKGPGLQEEVIPNPTNGRHQGNQQITEAGSCVVVEDASAFDSTDLLELEVLVWPTKPGGSEQVLVSRWHQDPGTGWKLSLDETGAPVFTIGDGVSQVRVALMRPLIARTWYHVVASWDSVRMAVAATPLGNQGFHLDKGQRRELPCKTFPAASGPILFAAMGTGAERPRFAGHFEGRLEAPALRGSGAEARWDFGPGRNTVEVRDNGPLALHGRAFNAPKRAVPGSRWTGDAHDFRTKPDHYGAIHFHSDDLYDAGWTPSLSVSLPTDLRSGFYALRLKREGPAYYAGFIVSPGPGQAQAPVAVVASTVTYLAYSNYRARIRPGPSELSSGCLSLIDLVDVYLMEHPEVGSSLYDIHPDGSGVSFVSDRRPLFNLRPTGRYWNMAIDVGLIHWLESHDIAYEVISDHEIHAQGAAVLAPYLVVLTGCHPEYHSRCMLDAFEAFLDRGGRLMYLGGNGFYWAVSFDPDQPGLMEMRRAEDGTRSWIEEPGAYHHQTTGELGGLWRRLGRPPNRLLGIGFIAQGFDRGAGYRRTEASLDSRVDFMFEGVEEEVLGDHGAWGDGAVGLEVDCASSGLGAPPHVLTVATSEPLTSAYLLVNEEIGSNRQGIDGATSASVRADMVFFETPSGGAVFSTGSIAFIGGLWKVGSRYDNALSRVVLNVVRRFADPRPF